MSEADPAEPTETELVHLPDLDGDGRGVLFEGAPKTVRLALEEGDHVPAHRHPDTAIVCYVIEGRLDVTLGDETVELVAGDAARFSGDQDISPAAQEDSVALLVLAEG